MQKIPQYRHGKISQNFVQELLFRLKPICELKKNVKQPLYEEISIKKAKKLLDTEILHVILAENLLPL